MKDHLESYRRMVRSIRFVPPLLLTKPSPDVEKPLPAVNFTSNRKLPVADVLPASVSVDPSAHTAHLVQEAVGKQTVLPVNYTILENIGDRISRLAANKAVAHKIILPKIPQPDPNRKQLPTVKQFNTQSSGEVTLDGHPDTLEAVGGVQPDSEYITHLILEAVYKPTVLPEKYTVLEDIGDRIGRLNATNETAPEQTTLAETKVDVSPVDEASIEPTPDAEISPVAETQLEPTPVTVSPTDADILTPVDEASIEPTPDAEISPVAETQLEPTPVNVPELDAVIPVVEAALEDIINAEPKVDSVTPVVEAALDNLAHRASDASVSELKATPTASDKNLSDRQSEDSPKNTQQVSTVDRVEPTVEILPIAQDNTADQLGAIAESSTLTEDNVADKQSQITIECPKCESKDLRKNGHYKGKQKYICKDCGKQFMFSDSVEEPPTKQIKSSPKTPEVKVSDSPKLPDLTSKPSGGASKTKKQAKGFGKGKTK